MADAFGGTLDQYGQNKTFSGFWNKYGQYPGNSMVQASQDIYNNAGNNAQQAGNVYNQAGGLFGYNPSMGMGATNQAQSMFGNINPYLSSPNLSSLDMSSPLMGQNLLDQAGAYNPMQAATDRFNQMQSILQPYQDQQNSQLQDQLFRQGRLGSTGGSLQQQGLQDSFNSQANQNLLNAISSSEGTQNNLYNQGIGLANLGLGQQNQAYNQQYNNAALQGNMQNEGIQNALNLGGAFGNLGMNLSNLGLNSYQTGLQGQLGALNTQQGAYGVQQILPNTYGNIYNSAQNYTQNYNAMRAAQGNGGGLSGALGSLAGGFLGGMAGPIGMGVGNSIGGSMFGGSGGISYPSGSTYSSTGRYIFPNY